MDTLSLDDVSVYSKATLPDGLKLWLPSVRVEMERVAFCFTSPDTASTIFIYSETDVGVLNKPNDVYARVGSIAEALEMIGYGAMPAAVPR